MATKLAGSSFELRTIGDGKSICSGGGEGIEKDGGSAGSGDGCLFAGVLGSLRTVPLAEEEDCQNVISVRIPAEHVMSLPEAGPRSQVQNLVSIGCDGWLFVLSHPLEVPRQIQLIPR